jgi:O-methyltransferase involved in polyketide biosynthesis
MVMGVEDKLDSLFSFIKTHLKHKSIVFFATSAQVTDRLSPLVAAPHS